MQRNVLKGTVLFALLLTGVSCSKKESNLSEPSQAIKVKSEVVKKVVIANPKSYAATVEPEQIATIGFSVPGTVNGVFVQEGQHVQAGQQLARLDDQEFSNAYQIAAASYDQVLDLYNRFTKLYEKGSLPEREYLDIKTKLAQAKASKNISSKQLGDASLKASFHGVITMKSVEKGMVVAPGQPMFTLANLDQVFAKINVPESEITQFKKGQQANLFIASLQKEFQGTIDLINPQADPVTRTYMVKVRIQNANQEILGGMLGDVWIKEVEKEEIIIPASAIHKGENGVTNVYVLNGGSTGVVKKRVKVSNVRGANDLVIQSGLEVGERVVITSSARLYEGAVVAQ
ncbi:efflux RND transporter periplasmic adaptor subunit [Myroides sp. WP-1]|uniref:efflux RND transporter periplasmic adaptor subunit n=1 Tax=Myroides sp. WP-1 TaxID=2759944 RepID=UPI0015FAAD2A|nr:efflux RND transporter periplasmic adaptor subunit [Myroides sp. WP-1]MBB1140736.1 efflux RND transporter periplasmic adaptor subunit [Myroides sp. WP-1]